MIKIGNTQFKIIGNYININLVNLSNEQVNIRAGTKLGEAEYHTQVVANKIHKLNDDGNAIKQFHYRPLTPEDICCDDVEATNKLLEILNNHRSACWIPGEPLGHFKGDKLQLKFKTLYISLCKIFCRYDVV